MTLQASKLLANLLLVAIFSKAVLAQTSNCTYQRFLLANYSGGFEYSATLSSLGNCARNQIAVSKLYLAGTCIENRDSTTGVNCSREGGAANTTSCTDVFTKASSSNLVNISTNERVSDRGNPLEFDSGTVCNFNATEAYVFVNSTCNYDPTLILLNPIADPDDCRTYKAYNYGAAIGIVVAVVVGIALLVVGFIFFYRRSRSRQGRYEAHHDIHMQPYPEGAAGQAYNSEGYSSSSLPAQQTASTDRMRPAYPVTGSSAPGVVQGTPVYPPWTGGGFKPASSSTPK